MNAENFSQYITNPSQLHQVSYQELKSLVLQYPYALTLHYLLLRKAKMDNNEDYEKLLNKAATYSFDRSALFQKMKNWEQEVAPEENYLLQEDYLELKDLAVLEQELVTKDLKEKPQELTFSLDEISVPQKQAPLMSTKSDNLAEDELGESLLERILNDDIEPITEQEAVNNADLKEFHAALDNLDLAKITEEQIIEESISELKEQEAKIEKVELPAASPSEWLANTVKEIEAEEEAALESPDAFSTSEEEVGNVENEAITLSELNKKDKVEEAPDVISSEDIPLEITNESSKKSVPKRFVKPLPKSAFNSWLQQYPYKHLGRKLDSIDELPVKAKKKKKKKANKIKEKEVIGVAKASVSEDDEIATETLAMLLEKQGHYNKAIKMYELLSLAMPEKSSFFAAKISSLQEIIKIS